MPVSIQALGIPKTYIYGQTTLLVKHHFPIVVQTDREPFYVEWMKTTSLL